jgi:hypothetical protein
LYLNDYRGYALTVILLSAPPVVLAQTDEIQVYDAEIAGRGVFNRMIHTNFTPIGRKRPDFPGGIIPNHSVNRAAEWAYGVTDWFEQGLYLSVWTPYSVGRGGSINGLKLWERFVPAARPATTRSFMALISSSASTTNIGNRSASHPKSDRS